MALTIKLKGEPPKVEPLSCVEDWSQELKVRMITLFSFLIFGFFYIFHGLKKEHALKALLPVEIEITEVSLNHEESGISESCGIIIYKISDETIQKINQQGLSFFQKATKARRYNLANKNSSYYSYDQWEKTPFQDKDKKIFWSGLSCAHRQDLKQSLYEQIIHEVSANHSYYTGHNEGKLVVIPSMRIAIFSHVG